MNDAGHQRGHEHLLAWGIQTTVEGFPVADVLNEANSQRLVAPVDAGTRADQAGRGIPPARLTPDIGFLWFDARALQKLLAKGAHLVSVFGQAEDRRFFADDPFRITKQSARGLVGIHDDGSCIRRFEREDGHGAVIEQTKRRFLGLDPSGRGPVFLFSDRVDVQGDHKQSNHLPA